MEQFHCTACDGYFPEHQGTIFHGKRVAVEADRPRASVLGRGAGHSRYRPRVRVAQYRLAMVGGSSGQLKAFSAYFLCNVHVNQLQLDELYAVLRGVSNGEISEATPSSALSVLATGCGR